MHRAILAAAVGILCAGCAVTRTPSPEAEPADPPVPLDPRPLVVPGGPIEVAPGETQPLPRPARLQPYGGTDPVSPSAPVAWTVVEGRATVDPGGRLTIPADVSPGSRIILRVSVEAGSTTVPVTVVDPAPNPVAGVWTQAAPSDCTGGSDPSVLVRELIFRRGGEFRVTQTPFESYYDYWGSYRYDVASQRLTLTVEGGNSLPGFRTAVLQATVNGAGELVLSGPPLLRGTTWADEPRCTSVHRRLGE